MTGRDLSPENREGNNAMAKNRRISTHEPDETEPCEECRAEIALLRRAQELKDEGLEGRALIESVLTSFESEQALERMWRRRAKK